MVTGPQSLWREVNADRHLMGRLIYPMAAPEPIVPNNGGGKYKRRVSKGCLTPVVGVKDTLSCFGQISSYRLCHGPQTSCINGTWERVRLIRYRIRPFSRLGGNPTIPLLRRTMIIERCPVTLVCIHFLLAELSGRSVEVASQPEVSHT